MNLHILVGDITTINNIDVIVNSANKSLLRGSGVCGSIHKAGGQIIEDECKRKYPNGIEDTQVGITIAGNLKAKYLLHVVTPKYHLVDDPLSLLRESYKNIFKVAEELECQSICLPFIGAGVCAYPKELAGTIALEEIYKCNIDNVVIVLYKESDKKYFNSKTRGKYFQENIPYVNQFKVKNIGLNKKFGLLKHS